MKLALLAVLALAALALVAAQDPVAPISGGTTFANSNCAAGTCKYGSACKQCNAGTFEPAWGRPCASDVASASGYPCANVPAAGHWSPAGSAKTFACPAGTTSAGGRTATGCSQCNYGTYSPSAGGGCIACPEHHYQPQPGKTSCKRCPVGSKSVPDRGQCVLANGAPATETALVEMESEGGPAEIHPFTPISPGKKFIKNESPVEKLKARVNGQ